MTTKQLSGSDLREAVFEIIGRELGPAALVRYIAENFAQPGRDYTEERSKRSARSVDDILGQVSALKASRGGDLPSQQAAPVNAPSRTRRKRNP